MRRHLVTKGSFYERLADHGDEIVCDELGERGAAVNGRWEHEIPGQGRLLPLDTAPLRHGRQVQVPPPTRAVGRESLVRGLLVSRRISC